MMSSRLSSVTTKMDEAQAIGREVDRLLISCPIRRILFLPEEELLACAAACLAK